MQENSHATRRKRRGGFTLLEMVAALVLMTILFAALTSLLRGFANQERALARFAELHPPVGQLATMLRRDITNARYYRSSARTLVLSGNLAQDRDTRSPNGRQAEVTYYLDSIAGEPWLIRREVPKDAAFTQGPRVEPVWQSISAIEFQAAIASTPEITELRSPPPVPDSPSGMASIPGRVQLTLRRDDSLPLLELNVVHHWEDN